MGEITRGLRLDDLYRMVAHIYADKNIGRTVEATFAHFVEVCGMLTIHDRKKKREGVEVTDALCKTLGWYFPLLAKLRVRSAEEIIFRKFPLVCPYCRTSPHKDAVCKTVRGTQRTLDNETVSRLYKQNWDARPGTLDDWQAMFQAIYPRGLEEHGRSTIGLLEELGELAEALRVFDRHPKYFLGEAADTFSYIMGIANEHAMTLAQGDVAFSLQDEFIRRYPGLCTQCGSKVCVCPTVPAATIGRMAKELNIGPDEHLFTDDVSTQAEEGRQVAHRVLETFGGYAGLTAQLPFDRGDANRAVVTLCLRIAQGVEGTKPETAEVLRTEAYRIATAAKAPGSPRQPLDIELLLNQIGAAWRGLDDELRAEIKSSGNLLQEFGDILDTVRVLFLYCTPTNENQIRVTAELRAIRDSLKRATKGNRVVVDDLPAATPNDLRRALLDKQYDIVHFSGHADANNLVFEADGRVSTEVPLSALADLVKRYPSVRCVILNACDTVKNLNVPISPCTIGMDETIDDDAAIEFSRGFYDALAAGKSIDHAYTEGTSAVQMAGHGAEQIKMIKM